jgi:hypothetical protein
MSLRPVQFTILQLATLIVSFAIVFALTRSVAGPVFFAFFSFAPALFMKRHPEDPGFLAYAIAGLIYFIGIAIACFGEELLPRELERLGREASWLVQGALGVLWGAIVCVASYSSAELTRRYINRRPPGPPRANPDATCGPIVWRPLDGK